jgi:hypothetical protein
MLPHAVWTLYKGRHWVGMKLTSRLFQLQVLKIINTTAQVHAIHLSGAGIFHYQKLCWLHYADNTKRKTRYAKFFLQSVLVVLIQSQAVLLDTVYYRHKNQWQSRMPISYYPVSFLSHRTSKVHYFPWYIWGRVRMVRKESLAFICCEGIFPYLRQKKKLISNTDKYTNKMHYRQ